MSFGNLVRKRLRSEKVEGSIYVRVSAVDDMMKCMREGIDEHG